MGIIKFIKKLFYITAIIFGVSFLLGIIAHFWEDGLGREKIAIITVKGLITDSKDVIEQIQDAQENSDIKGIVIRINSPGGGVGATQEIYREVARITNKKVVASMGSIAASGGYYIASATEKIYANPGTLTGSIGVIMEFANIEEVLGKIGVKSYTIKSGEYKDIGSPLRPMSDTDRELLQGVIDNVYRQFVKAVAKGRKLPEDYVTSLADGRIYTGEQAKDLKLADEIGNLQDAIDGISKMAGLKEKPFVKYMGKKKFSLFSLIMGEEAESVLSNFSSQMYGLSYLYIPGRTFSQLHP